ncbi:MAG: DUF4091 domain-containing protein [Candidatus Lokiarchaeota archaeon]|nr:DUF4091 domain-containing protein [Candidatus Lokiarchaeota archaeon]
MERDSPVVPPLAPSKTIPSHVHLVLSASSSLGILAFLGSVLLYPGEILGSSEGMTTFWVPTFVMIGLNAAFFLGAFFKRTWGHLLVLAGDAILVAAIAFMASEFWQLSADNHEPWIVQVAWFVRNDPLPTSMALGAAMYSSVVSLSYLMALVPVDKTNGKEKSIVEFGFIMVMVAGAFAMFQLAYRFTSMTHVLVVMFAIASFSTIASVPPLLRSFRSGAGELELLPGCTAYYPSTRSFTPPAMADPLSKLHERIESAGNERISFWWAFMILLLVDAGMAYLVIDSYPANNETNFLFFLYFFLIWLVLVAYSYSRRRSDNLRLDKGIKRWKSSGLAYVDGFRFIALAAACFGMMYFFRYPLYIPEVLGKIAAFGVPGSLIALISFKRKVWNHVLYLIFLCVIVVNYVLLLNDVLSNAYNLYGPQDVLFPFQYVHSGWHVASAGLCSGFLLANELVRFATRHNDGGDSIQRSMLVTIASFLLPGVAIYMGVGIIGSQIPGGRPEVWVPIDLSIEGTRWLLLACLVCAWLAVLAVVLYLAKNVHLAGLKYLARRARNPLVAEKAGYESRRAGSAEARKVNRPAGRSISASAFIVLAVVGLIAGAGTVMWHEFTSNQQRPLVYYAPGRFALWLANSTERFDPDTVVSLDPANLVTTFSIQAAANEYEAFQIIYTPLGKSMNDLYCQFTSFTNINNGSQTIPSTAFNIRHAENIIGDKFPDVLVPFSRLQVTGTRNRAFWVSVKVPYGTSPGSYAGTLYFKYDYNVELSHENATIPIHFTIDVYNFTIPHMRHLRTQMGGRSGDTATVQNFFDHRINDYGIDIPSSWNGTNYTYSWATWDANIAWKLANGANSFIISGGPGWTYGDGRTPFIDDPASMNKLTNWLKGVQQHLVEKNWTRYGYIYYIDEFQMFIPSGYHGNRTAYFADLEAQLQAMKAAAPLLRIMTTTPPSHELLGIRDYIDIYCPIAVDYNQTEWEGQKAQGKEFWQYYCVGPSAPWPNSHLYNRLFETRVMLWQCFYYNIQGFLYWSSNAEYHGSYGFGYNGWGDGWFIHYDDAGTPYDSPRWENYRDAQEDYEYLWLANRSISWLWANSTTYTSTQLDEFQAAIQDAVTAVSRAREVHAQHPAAIHQARASIARMLEQFASSVDLLALGEAQWWPV